jgi:hypothetical protein
MRSALRASLSETGLRSQQGANAGQVRDVTPVIVTIR